LHCSVHDGHTVVLVGNRAVASYDNDDTGMRNLTIVTLTELGFSGRRVADVLGLTPEYVSMLRGRARREGSAGLVRIRGRRPKLSAAQVRGARAWQAEGLSTAEIARRLGVSDKTAARVLTRPDAPASTPAQPELDLAWQPEPQPEPAASTQEATEATQAKQE